jgi:hypothetical protein
MIEVHIHVHSPVVNNGQERCAETVNSFNKEKSCNRPLEESPLTGTKDCTLHKQPQTHTLWVAKVNADDTEGKTATFRIKPNLADKIFGITTAELAALSNKERAAAMKEAILVTMPKFTAVGHSFLCMVPIHADPYVSHILFIIKTYCYLDLLRTSTGEELPRDHHLHLALRGGGIV